ncbi:hypothetical protein AB0L40_04090 [Patulibacter sp. NPDC049589]|uniref:hypothetical protein n=1 Tax=Patulibacter sp. NPDC049589 TaxID=3154731 RepID=UPI00342F3EE3
MSTPDPFDQIATQLRRAHHLRPDDCDAVPTPPPAGRRHGRLPVLAVLAGLAVGGTATAAAIVATRSPSRPLSGRLVPGAGPSDGRYVVRIGPSLDAGDTSWCTTTQVRVGDRIAGSSGCGGAATTRQPVVAAGGLMDVSRGGTSVLSAVVDRRVSAMRLPSGRRITPVRAPELPDGFRAIVATSDAGDAEGDPVFEGRDGRPIPAPTGRSFLPRQATRDASTASARTAPCSIAGTGSARLGTQRVLRSPPTAAPRANGRPFLTCASVVVRMRGRRFVAAVLLDAKHPGDRPAPLPGAVRESDGTYRAEPALSAVRSRDTWLVVRGVDGAVRRAVLRRLSVHRGARR